MPSWTYCPECKYLIIDLSAPCPSCGAAIPASAASPAAPGAHHEGGERKKISKRTIVGILLVVIVVLAAGGGFYYFQSQGNERAEAEAIRIEQERIARLAQERAAAVSVAVAGPEVQNALSARPIRASYIMARLNNIGGMLQGVFSQANIDMIAPLVPPDELNILRVAAEFASQIPAESMAFIFGVEKTGDITPFFQLAASMPESVRPELNRMAAGEATSLDIVTLLLGRGALPFAAFVDVTSNHGAMGPYYSFGIPEEILLVAAARDDFLLLALSSDDLAASIDALENAGNRLVVNRRFNTPDFYFLHIDVPTLTAMGDAYHEAALQEMDLDVFPDYGPFADLRKLITMPPPLLQVMRNFRAPWEFEVAFESQPGRFTVSSGTNVFNVVTSFEGLITEPAIGANMFLAGSGRLFYAYATPVSFFFNPSAFDASPEFAAMWRNQITGILPPGVTLNDLENLLAGTLSIALGSDFTFMDMRVPGGYIALTGQGGAAARIFSALRSSVPPFIPLQQLQVSGWDSLFMVSPNMFIPIPVIAGVSGETLFVGLLDPDGMGGTPEIPPQAARLFSEPAVYVSFLDTAAIWSLLREELSNANSLLNLALMNFISPQEMAEHRRIFLDSELSVPFIKLWAPDFERSFMEFTIADVPPGRCVMIRLLPLLTATIPNPVAAANFSAEASNTVSNLRSLQSASLMLFADNINTFRADAPPATIVIGGSELALTPNPDLALLTQYTSNPHSPVWENFDFHFVGDGPITDRAWWVSARVAEQGVRDILVTRAASVGLFSAPHAPDNIGSPDYDGTTERVFLLIRNPRS